MIESHILQGPWLAQGFDSGTLEHRKQLLGVVVAYMPFETLLDVGCATGPDLFLYSLAFPNAKLTGIEIDQDNVKQAKGSFKIIQSDLRDELPKTPDKSYDIVTSNGVMMYHDFKYINDLIRIAKKAVIMSERNPYKNRSIGEYLKNNQIQCIITRVTGRDSWRDDGFIYNIKI